MAKTSASASASASTLPPSQLLTGWAEDVRQTKRNAVLVAAAEVFGQRGLDGATMREIALKAGCTTGAIYPLFPSKENIYAELLSASLAELYGATRLAFDQSPTAPYQAAASAFLAYYLARPYEVNLGLYAFNGLKQTGVGKQQDQALNDVLAQTLFLLAPHNRAASKQRPSINAMTVFAQLIGTLVLHQAGRLKSTGHEPQDLIDHFLHNQRDADNPGDKS